MKLSEYAKLHNVTYRTAWEWFRTGKIKNAVKDEHNNIIINEISNINYNDVAIYCRVSSNKQKNDLERQCERVKNYAINNGFDIKEIVKEVGSGVNDNRKKLIYLLKKKSWNTLIVEHSDRLTRFGFNYLKILLELNNKKIIVINQCEDEKTDLMQDMISILYSFSARMYGKRKSSRKKAEDVLKKLQCD
jgi:putative resolvase